MAEYSRFLARHLESENNLKLLEATYRLRYQVYCQESGFLPEEPYKADGLESDVFDEKSEHIIVEEKASPATPLLCGTIRLVHSSNELGLPTRHFCPDLDTILPDVPRDEIGEISRLCISRNYRRRLSDGLYGIESYTGDAQHKRRKYPIVLILLFRKMYLVSQRVGIKYWLATIERRLAEVLAKYSIHLNPLMDGFIDYYGAVRPYFGQINEIRDVMFKEDPYFCEFFENNESGKPLL